MEVLNILLLQSQQNHGTSSWRHCLRDSTAYLSCAWGPHRVAVGPWAVEPRSRGTVGPWGSEVVGLWSLTCTGDPPTYLTYACGPHLGAVGPRSRGAVGPLSLTVASLFA